MGRPVGKQDHYASTFGGLNVFQFWASGRVTHDPLMLNLHQITKLFSHFLLFLDGHKDAATVLTEQNEKTDDNDGALIAMRDQVEVMQKLLNSNYSTKDFGSMLHQGWTKNAFWQRQLAVLRLIVGTKSALDAGAYGGKLCGAGGGGFLLLLPPEVHDEIRKHLSDLKKSDLF